MKKQYATTASGLIPKTVYSKGSEELIPQRFRRIITVVMPILYTLLFLFGLTAAIVPVPTFLLLVGTVYGSVWATILAIASLISLISLIFRLKIEIYSSIVVTILLAVYPFYVGYLVVHDATATDDISRLGVMFAVATYAIMPGWRVVDIVLEIRKSKRRQLYAESLLGEDDATHIS